MKIPAEHDWAGRFDGVDVFTKEAEEFMGPATVTNGDWTFKYYDETGVEPFGTGFIIERPQNLAHHMGCDVINPHTGKALEIAGPEDICPEEGFTSPDSNIVAFKPPFAGTDTLPGIVSLSTGKVFEISEEISFHPTAVTNDGLVYGTSKDTLATFDLNKDSQPKKVPGSTESPILVAPNGIAAFSGGYFVVKK